jgi:hypothetical protein
MGSAFPANQPHGRKVRDRTDAPGFRQCAQGLKCACHFVTIQGLYHGSTQARASKSAQTVIGRRTHLAQLLWAQLPE